MGHIKVLAGWPADNDFLFMSLTRLGEVDVKASSRWNFTDCAKTDNIEISINVLVFGYSMTTVEKVVKDSLETTGMVWSAADSSWDAGNPRS